MVLQVGNKRRPDLVNLVVLQDKRKDFYGVFDLIGGLAVLASCVKSLSDHLAHGQNIRLGQALRLPVLRRFLIWFLGFRSVVFHF